MKFIKCNSINVYKKKLKTQANTHIMNVLEAEEPKTYQNLTVSEETPSEAMLAFMLRHLPNPQANKDKSTHQLNKNLEQAIFDMLLDDSARMLQQVGLVSPPQSPRLPLQVPGAPEAPSRPTRLAVAQASGQPLTTALRKLFAVVPAVVPDA